jgi:hypothetical protein
MALCGARLMRGSKAARALLALTAITAPHGQLEPAQQIRGPKNNAAACAIVASSLASAGLAGRGRWRIFDVAFNLASSEPMRRRARRESRQE